MCFFALYRYRVCQHDQIGPFVAFCTTAKTQAYSGECECDSAQPSRREWFSGYGGSPDSIITMDDYTKFTYCGQPLFSPAYINDFGSDSENCGICQNCNPERKLRYKDEERIDNYPRLVWNTESKIGLLKSNHDQIPMRTTTDVSFQPHFFGPGAESCLLSDPSLPRYRPLRAGTLRCYSTHPPPLYLSHPLPQPTRRAIHAPYWSATITGIPIQTPRISNNSRWPKSGAPHELVRYPSTDYPQLSTANNSSDRKNDRESTPRTENANSPDLKRKKFDGITQRGTPNQRAS